MAENNSTKEHLATRELKSMFGQRYILEIFVILKPFTHMRSTAISPNLSWNALLSSK